MKRTPLNRKRRLSFRSRKRAALYRNQRVQIVASMLESRPVCERCHAARSVDVHELLSRGRGGSITDVELLVALCRACHEEVTQNPKQAHLDGWLLHSWEVSR